MAVSHSNAARVAATQAITGNGTVSTGLVNTATTYLVFRTTGTLTPSTGAITGTALCTIGPLDNPAFGAAGATGVATAVTSGSPAAVGQATVPAATSGTIAQASIQTAAGNAGVVILCSVSNAGGDIILSGSLAVGTGDTIICTSLTYNALNN